MGAHKVFLQFLLENIYCNCLFPNIKLCKKPFLLLGSIRGLPCPQVNALVILEFGESFVVIKILNFFSLFSFLTRFHIVSSKKLKSKYRNYNRIPGWITTILWSILYCFYDTWRENILIIPCYLNYFLTNKSATLQRFFKVFGRIDLIELDWILMMTWNIRDR